MIQHLKLSNNPGLIIAMIILLTYCITICTKINYALFSQDCSPGVS